MKMQVVFAVLATSLGLISAAPPMECQVDRETYKIGKQWHLNRCIHCICGPEAVSSCFVNNCFPLSECVDFEYTIDDCCPKCPNGPNCYLEGVGLVAAGKTVLTDNGETCTCGAKYNATKIPYPLTPLRVDCTNTSTNIADNKDAVLKTF